MLQKNSANPSQFLPIIDRISSAIDAAANRTGWQRYAIAMVMGIFATLAMAPFYILPLLIIGYSIFARQLSAEKITVWQSFLIGWAFGFGYFITGIYWMAFAFLVRAEEFAWMVPIAIPSFAGFLGLFFAMPAALFNVIRTRLKVKYWAQLLLLAGLVSIFEYGRGHILTGLPWNLTGQAMTGMIAGAQSASLYGVYGLSLVTLLLAMAPAMARSHNSFIGIIVSISGFLVLFGIGAIQLVASPPSYRDDVRVSIIQPNIRQKDKINPALATQNFQSLLSLSALSSAGSTNKQPATFLIWPENAVPWIAEQPIVLDLIGDQVSPQTTIITGSIRRESRNDGSAAYFNTVAILPPVPPNDGQSARNIGQYYDKHHLVPFGEYLPLKGLLQAIGLSQLAPVVDGFAKGAGPQTISHSTASFSPLICYETIFPGAMHPHTERPDWLVTVTNDAWFGDGSGPRQHLDQARLRSIETGLPMARAANTGISSMIDPHGRVLERVKLYETGFIDTALPNKKSPTLYSRIGDTLYGLMVMMLGLIIFVRGRIVTS